MSGCLLQTAAGADTAQSPSGASPSVPEDARPQAVIPRFPAVSARQIAFVCAGQLWLVPRAGGAATPLTQDAGPKRSPKFSPDGRTVAFTGGYDGLYTIPVTGGAVTRVTHQPGATDLCGWTPDGRLLFMTDAFLFVGNFDGQSRIRQLFTVPAAGGLPRRLPVPYGANGTISPDGRWLAYTPYAEGQREHRKRYRGGLAPDIWLFNLRSHGSRRVTDGTGTDTAPMWHGQTLYYVSDAGPERRRNVWAYSPGSGRRRQVTHFRDFDVVWPSVGPGPEGQGEIVFVNGARLYLLDLGNDKARAVNVMVPGDRLGVRPHAVDAGRFLGKGSPSPDGRQAVVEARGDLWVVATEQGPRQDPPRNLTRTSGVEARYPSWSPDGRWIAYFSDASGEYQLTIIRPDGAGGPRQLTHLGPGFRYAPVWSPDSRRIAFSDSTGSIYLQALGSPQTVRIHRDSRVRQPQLSWSPDSSWLAYTGSVGGSQALWLYGVATGETHQLTGGGYDDRFPTFDRRGDYLYFVSDRNFDPLTYDSVDYSAFIYPTTDLVLAVPLRRDLGAPWQPRRDGPSRPPAGPARPLAIDFNDFERRAVVVASDQGRYSDLAVSGDGRLLYSFVPGGQPAEGTPSVRLVDFGAWRRTGERTVETVLSGTADFRPSASGQRLLVRDGGTLAAVDAAPDQKTDKPVSLAGMAVEVQPRSEWRQIFTEAWRLYRDFFYDPAMRGLNWARERDKYATLLDACTTREDVDYVIGEMLGELSSSHVYLNPPPGDSPPPEAVGMLGADFALDRGAYRIVKIFDSAPSDTTVRNPLRQPGVNVKEGEYLLAVNGRRLDTRQDPWAAFKGTAGKDVTLTVSDEPTLDRRAREVVVRPGDFDSLYRHRAWIEANRAYVERRGGGRIGYVYLPLTSEYGFREFTRQFGPQRGKRALIVDARWNQGGHIPYHLVDILGRRRDYFDGVDLRRSKQRSPGYMFEGPRCLLVNGVTMSGGDFLAYLFHARRLGELIGTRTMGSMVGAGGVNVPFIDGGYSLPPNVGFYDAKGKLVGEGHGVDPDVPVIDDPARMMKGRDPQLDAAVRRMLRQIGASVRGRRAANTRSRLPSRR